MSEILDVDSRDKAEVPSRYCQIGRTGVKPYKSSRVLCLSKTADANYSFLLIVVPTDVLIQLEVAHLLIVPKEREQIVLANIGIGQRH